MFRFISLIFTIVLCLAGLSKTHAQLCAGSLGNPVINIDFGAGSTQNTALPPGVTNYRYMAADCPNDGEYAIQSTTTNCFFNSWYSLTEDHTPGDVNGNMMIVNASNTPGQFYVDEVDGLCGGTTYEFAAWMVNIIKPASCGGNTSRPNVIFSIETLAGEVLMTYQTGPINAENSPVWRQFGLFFTTPDNVKDVKIRMTNTAPGGCGNDVILDDITFRPCGPNINTSVDGLGAAINVCQGDTSTFSLNADITPFDPEMVFQWQISTNKGANWTDIQGATQQTFVRLPTDTGVYMYRLAVAKKQNITFLGCRVLSSVTKIKVNAFPQTSISNNGPLCSGDTLRLNATGGTTYTWTGPFGFTSSAQSPVLPNTPYVQTGLKYYVTVSDTNACTWSDSTSVTVDASPVIDAGVDQTMCEGDSVILRATGAGGFAWSPGNGLSSVNTQTTTATPVITTMYRLSVLNDLGCNSSDSVTVTVIKKPLANAGPDQKIFKGQSVTLAAQSTDDGMEYLWTPGTFISNAAVLNPIVSPPSDIIYTLKVSAQNGCGSDTDEVFVRVFEKVIVANAFSPNGDGINDFWNIEALETYPKAVVNVFNRAGQQVYTSRGYVSPWNGTVNAKPLPIGTYYYLIDLQNGTPRISGWVAILR